MLRYCAALRECDGTSGTTARLGGSATRFSVSYAHRDSGIPTGDALIKKLEAKSYDSEVFGLNTLAGPVARRRRPALQVCACQQDNPRPVRAVGDITLMEAWTSRKPDRRFSRQIVEIRQETRNARLERDGTLSVTSEPMRVTWFGGGKEDLINVERIKIVSRGVILVETSLCLDLGSVAEFAGGVTMQLVTVP